MVLRDMRAPQERLKRLQEAIAVNINDENSRSRFVLTAVAASVAFRKTS